tara:strand:+ start:6693 stop:6860 length:168 start_codon:yes stop_codon:yes gene_type:complete
MVTNEETTVKVSKWLVKEIQKFINSSKKNRAEFPSKRNFVDVALIKFLENKEVKL